MKKSFFMLGMASFAFLAFVSCKKTETKAVSFDAITVDFVEEERAYLDGSNHIYMEQGDIAKMFNISSNPAESECADYAAQSTGTRVRFHAVEQMTVQSKGNFYSFFPGQNVTPDLANENRATFEVSPVQDYYVVNGTPSFSKKDMYMCAKAENVSNINNAVFKYQSIMGVLRVKLYDAEPWTIRSLTVTDNVYNLSGDVNLKVNAVTNDNLMAIVNSYDPANPAATADAISDYKEMIGYNVTNKGMSITLDFGENGLTLSTDANNPSVCYIVLRPLALAHGVHLVATDMNGGQHVLVDNDENKKIKPNSIKTITVNAEGLH
jgi:hypothetical protein